ncbi:hypothetical protein AAFF_G00165570 [Aldrovandia affinis]|uniref:Uncharacterized protein n=1 Tax=Aldrovandia affinis TaxID=143900 RepID=A0AAD7RPX9_9TELE|nr:hypothetical protein AAFF_G00165570 [Aldrovandia affinis]
MTHCIACREALEVRVSGEVGRTVHPSDGPAPLPGGSCSPLPRNRLTAEGPPECSALDTTRPRGHCCGVDPAPLTGSDETKARGGRHYSRRCPGFGFSQRCSSPSLCGS